MSRLIFEKGSKGRRAVQIPSGSVPAAPPLAASLRRSADAPLPEVSELDVVRHFTRLSRKNFSVDTHYYPLGSCTMKYNPKCTEDIARLPGFASLHPYMAYAESTSMLAQGAYEVIYRLEHMLAEITGMKEVTTQPMAGAHGELTGIMLIAAYHRARKNDKKYVIVPDSSHGTNPASAAVGGYDIVSVPTGGDGCMDMKAFREALSPQAAAVMLTCPNTLGIFNCRIGEITDHAHKADALMYYDGANLNAMLGKCRPGDIGFDIVHLNLHKTFGTPHGGGGPGAGPVGVTGRLAGFLPVPRIRKNDKGFFYCDTSAPDTIGPIAPFFGNFGVLLKAFAYILLLGRDGLIDVSEKAVLNANYCLAKLKDVYTVPYDRTCMHEFVLSASCVAAQKVRALDIAKFLIDNGIHPPTVYFPLIVKEAMMVEPTETESVETLEGFIEIMRRAVRLAAENPVALTKAPVTTPVGRLDEVKAARELNCSHI